MRTTSSTLIALCLLAVSCGSPPGATSSNAALIGVITDNGGSIISYDNLEDQILDSDAVVSGTLLGVEPAGEETAQDGAEYPLRYVHLLLEVDEVLYSAPAVRVERGQILRIEMPQPELMSIDEANRAVSGKNYGIHFLFNAESFMLRVGDPAIPDNADSIWLYQNGRSVAISDAGAVIGSPEGVPGSPIRDWAEFEDLVEATSQRVETMERPRVPIGLADHSAAFDTQPEDPQDE